MRHRISGNRLGRNSGLRKATIRDLAKATIIRERICTTLAKAKEACKMVDHLITLGKQDTLAAKRRAFAILCDHQVVSDLFKIKSPRFKERTGGYTRIIHLSTRKGDNAQLAYLELTEKSAVVVSKPKTTASSKPKEAKYLEATSVKTEETINPAEKFEPEAKTAKPTKPVFKPSQIKDDKSSQVKGKFGKNFMGGLKQIFRKKPSE